MSWYYYLEGKISFPFQARCVATTDVSPLRKGETAEVVRMAAENVCEHDMLVQIRWQGRKMAVPLSQLTAIDPDESTKEAIGDWHYWVSQGCILWGSMPRRQPAPRRAGQGLSKLSARVVNGAETPSQRSIAGSGNDLPCVTIWLSLQPAGGIPILRILFAALIALAFLTPASASPPSSGVRRRPTIRYFIATAYSVEGS